MTLEEQIKRAIELLESNGYIVTKRLKTIPIKIQNHEYKTLDDFSDI